MPKENFGQLGKQEAIQRLFEGTGFTREETCSFGSNNGSVIREASALLLEGIDFDLTYFPLKHLGYKCVTRVTGELYASMSKPRTLSINIGISAKLDFGRIQDLCAGVFTAAGEYDYSSVKLDLTPSHNGLTIGISATGETAMLTWGRRPEPKSKDLICVSGSLGGAFFGMRVLENEKKNFEKDNHQPDLEKRKMFVGDYLKPELNPNIVRHLEEEEIYPSFGYFIIDGLADTVKRLVRDSGLGAKIYAEKIPFEGNSFELGKEMDIDPISAAMNGGSDYKLLFTIPILKLEKFRRDFQTFDIIGHLAQSDVGPVLVTPDGVELPIVAQGWKEEE